MNCFSHRDSVSVGICKSCQKAVCDKCAIDIGRGLACSSDCEEEVKALNQIVDRSKQIYSIGSKSRIPPTGVIMYLFFGLIFFSSGIYNYIDRERIDFISLSLGLAFLVFGVFAYFRTRKLNLNC